MARVLLKAGVERWFSKGVLADGDNGSNGAIKSTNVFNENLENTYSLIISFLSVLS